jgi:low temperature requirement protein LtrA
MTERPHLSALRQGDGADQVTNIELFFDLVYVFAVTQLSQLLVEHHTRDGAVQTAVLLVMVWQLWVYTTWAVNYLDPERSQARVVLILLMLGSLVLSAAIPDAFHQHGLLVAITYVSMQTGRVLYTIWALRGERLQMVFLRILPWTTASSVVVLVGGLEHGHGREALWAAAMAIDLVGAGFGFFVPGLGRSATTEWTISGGHFAERCQAFVLIALGESIIVIGSHLELDDPSWRTVVAFGGAFAGAVLLWWIYFDRAAGDSAELIRSSPDPGRLARSAFHWIHPLIIGGIIVGAAGDERVLEHLAEPADAGTAWLLLGGTGLFLGGHALFKAVVWRHVSWPRVGGVLALAAAGLLARHVTGLTLGLVVACDVALVAIGDHLTHPALSRPGSSAARAAAS